VKKTVKVLTTAALVASLAAPFAAPVSAANYSDAGVVTAQPAKTQNLGYVKVEVDAIKLSTTPAGTTDYLIVKLPSDFKFKDAAGTGAATVADIQNLFTFPTIKNAFAANPIKNVTILSDNEVKVEFDATSINTGSGETTAYFYLNFNNIEVPSGFSGEVKAEFSGKQDGVFSNAGSKTIATVGAGSVTASIDGVKTITNSASNSAIDNIRIKEDRPGAWEQNKTLKYKLPNGFEWDTTGATVTVINGDTALQTGGANPVSIAYDGTDKQTLVLTQTKANGTSQATELVIKGLKVVVADETLAKTGDVTVTLGGNASYKGSDFVVAKYGDFGAKVYAVGEPKTVTAGQTAQKLGKFAIEESVKGSLLGGRTITLTLDGKAKWAVNPSKLSEIAIDNLESKNIGAPLSNSQFGSNAVLVGGVDGNRQTLKITLGSGTSTDAIKAVIKDARVDVSSEAEGDIKVTVGGSAGLTGELVLGKVEKPVIATVEGELPKVAIGTQDQAIGDITIAETANENLDNASGENTLSLVFPHGVVPTLPTSVTVTEGDVALVSDSVKREYDGNLGRWKVSVNVKSTSFKASKVKFSGIKVTTDRTVPEGPLKVLVAGSSVLKTNLPITVNGNAVKPFAGDESVASVEVAKVVTPAPSDTTASNIVFKLNSKSFTVDGKEQQMDAAPLVGWDRAYLPVRFAANALNVSDNNIIWDDKTSTFTIFKGDRVITGKVGEKFLTVNGVKVPMDVPVWRNKAQTNNRVMVPIRYLANALNASIEWNKETSEITIQASK
jgi:hypothetical protein